MDTDLEGMSRDRLIAEIEHLRHGIRKHRDSSGQDLCWHHPALWSLLPEQSDPIPVVPDWPQFLSGCIRYRQSLDEQLPQASNSEMRNPARNTRATVIPCLRYRHAPAAIEWLCSTFGFEQQAVHSNPDGTIAHAQLTFGNGMVMLGSVSGKESEWGGLIKQPDEVGGAETQSAYLIVSDADAIYAKAKAAGADILLEIKNEDYGGRGFTCRDLEGHIWNFGTYDPW